MCLRAGVGSFDSAGQLRFGTQKKSNQWLRVSNPLPKPGEPTKQALCGRTHLQQVRVPIQLRRR